MKTNRVISATLALIFLLGASSVDASSLSASAANQSWKVQLFKGGVYGVVNLSTAFVGKYQTPMLSYGISGSHSIYWAHAATSTVPGNCGPNNSWYCNMWSISNLVPGTISPMATWQKAADRYRVQWAFSTGNMIQIAYIEFDDTMTYIGSGRQDYILLSKFGGTLVGTPSLKISTGNYHLALTVRDNTDLYGYKLVFMDYGAFSNTSCLTGLINYLCEVIDQSNGWNSMGEPSLSMAANGLVGIAYYKAGLQAGLMYAYQHTNSSDYPSNCGPGGTYWRCITIFANVGTSTIGTVVKSATGTSATNTGIAFTFGNTSAGKYLFNASYVDSGGNCGTDLNLYGVSVDKWNCHLVAFLGIPDRSYSIAVDPQGYSVIAMEYALADESPVDLYLTYPNARVGNASPGWTQQRIDGAPDTQIETGAQANLSLNSGGLGFIGYLQEEAYLSPNLKITGQQFRAFVPLVKR